MAMGESQRASEGEMPAAGHRRWSFGRAVLDERSLELFVDGESVRLERKPLEVLLYLLRHAGEVITKDELATAIWPGRILTETVLTRCISVLRQTLHDDDRSLIRTVHGYGYRLVAEIRFGPSTAPQRPIHDLKVGDHPPLRPQWKLVERLGRGGHGEAWLARHEKTGETRVFKFALDERTLTSLKREITLFRILQISPDARAAAVRVLEWNFDDAPYFIESEYVEEGNLHSYACSQGGLAQMTIERRLSIAASIADAVAALHSVGILHKDLKPANVLVDKSKAKLCDFGSGEVIDLERLDALMVTPRLELPPGETRHASMYMAPELLAGQPASVKTDIYALGVLLFQLAVGDLQAPLAPGWELDISDEILREDIAKAAAGNPGLRLDSAAEVATRLRSLSDRTRIRAAEKLAAQRAARARLALVELRRMQILAGVSVTLAVIAAAAGTIAHQARNAALQASLASSEATETAHAISRFLTDDVLTLDPAVERPKDVSYESLLLRAAAHVNERLGAQPQAAASVHWLLGRRFQEIGRTEMAMLEYEKASSFVESLEGSAKLPALLALDRLLPIYLEKGQRTETVASASALHNSWLALHGEEDLSTLIVRMRIARVMMHFDDPRSATELETVLRQIDEGAPLSEGTEALVKQSLGGMLTANTSHLDLKKSLPALVRAHANAALGVYQSEYVDQFKQGASKARAALETFRALLGPNSELTALSELLLAHALLPLGELKEAELLISNARETYASWLPQRHWLQSLPRYSEGRLRLEQQRPREAVSLFEQALDFCRIDGCPPRTREEMRFALGSAQLLMNYTDDAIKTLRDTLSTFEGLFGRNHLGSLRRRIQLAEAFRRNGDESVASSVLEVAQQPLLQRPGTTAMADYERARGLIESDRHQVIRAKNHLARALSINVDRYGSTHWRVQQLQADLKALTLH